MTEFKKKNQIFKWTGYWKLWKRKIKQTARTRQEHDALKKYIYLKL